jgi:hypothetical protein
MSGGERYCKVYHDVKENVYVKIDYYKRYGVETKELVRRLKLVEKRLVECTCQTEENKGNRHCVRYSYPYALTIPQYRKYIETLPRPKLEDLLRKPVFREETLITRDGGLMKIKITP